MDQPIFFILGHDYKICLCILTLKVLIIFFATSFVVQIKQKRVSHRINEYV